MMRALKTKSPLIAYYGDDFTGSTDVMESLARAGLRTVLFLSPPTPAQLARFPGLRAFGIAGGSRVMSGAQMDRELPRAFKILKSSGARFVHYKVCSTFDSSPTIGSIGRAIEIGRRTFGNQLTPLVVGVPVLGRYVVFGNLFAKSGLDSEPARLDRHPTMRHHPVTPMDESDLRLHLARQTSVPIELVDVHTLRSGNLKGHNGYHIPNISSNGASTRRHKEAKPVLLFDTLEENDLPLIGRAIENSVPASGQIFCVGSSGIEYALVAHWRNIGLLPAKVNAQNSMLHPPALTSPQIITVSGSCSPVTDRQIARALEAGFVEIVCDPQQLVDSRYSYTGVKEPISNAENALKAGRNVIFHTARGFSDKRRVSFEKAARKCKGTTQAEKKANASAMLGKNLALILHLTLLKTGARRVVVCGGDTSTHVARALGIEALEFVAPFAPGGPLCRVHAPNSQADGLEIIFKGGQVGRDSFFADLASTNVP